MAATDAFRRQHAEIADLVGQIEFLLEPAKLPGSAAEARGLLSLLLGKLSLHLAMEDDSLYPRAARHADARLRETASRFAAEMAGVRPTVEAFGARWSEDAIRADCAAFREEARRLFALLADRMRREDAHLYALVDAAA